MPTGCAALGLVVLVRFPDGYGVNVGVRAEGGAMGITGLLSSLFSSRTFGGISPGVSIQDTTTRPTGSWYELYAVLMVDPSGQLLPVEPPKVAAAPPEPPKPDPRLALLEAQRREIDRLRQEAIVLEAQPVDARGEVTVTVPTQSVTQVRVPCKVEKFIDAAGKPVEMCRGPNGSYLSTKVQSGSATATGVIKLEAGKKK